MNMLHCHRSVHSLSSLLPRLLAQAWSARAAAQPVMPAPTQLMPLNTANTSTFSQPTARSSERGISSSARADLRDFFDFASRENREPEASGRAWQASELEHKSWSDLHKLWYLCIKERNMLLTELGWQRVPKDLEEQQLHGMFRGHPIEQNLHRLRYNEVCITLGRIKEVLRERAEAERDVALRKQMLDVINAR